MPTYVDPAKCDGCKGGQRTACMYVCPNDLMLLDSTSMKAFNQEPDACWECYSCVKICPQGAISVRPYADFAPLGGVCLPLRGSQQISWTVPLSAPRPRIPSSRRPPLRRMPHWTITD